MIPIPAVYARAPPELAHVAPPRSGLREDQDEHDAVFCARRHRVVRASARDALTYHHDVGRVGLCGWEVDPQSQAATPQAWLA